LDLGCKYWKSKRCSNCRSCFKKTW